MYFYIECILLLLKLLLLLNILLLLLLIRLQCTVDATELCLSR